MKGLVNGKDLLGNYEVLQIFCLYAHNMKCEWISTHQKLSNYLFQEYGARSTTK